MGNLTIILFASTLTSLIGLAGGFFLLWKERLAYRWSSLLVSFAAGTLLAAAFLDLLPEAVGESDDPARILLYALWGILLFFLIEKSLLFHHHTHRHEDQYEETADALEHERLHEVSGDARKATIRPLIIFGDAIHNFIDGVIIAAAFSVSTHLGLIAALAVFFHEIPQEIGDFGILIHSGLGRQRVAWYNLFGALVSPIGSLVGFYTLGAFASIKLPLLALAAGGFVYIAAADLIPDIHRESRPRRIVGQVILLFLGIAILWLVGTLLPER